MSKDGESTTRERPETDGTMATDECSIGDITTTNMANHTTHCSTTTDDGDNEDVPPAKSRDDDGNNKRKQKPHLPYEL